MNRLAVILVLASVTLGLGSAQPSKSNESNQPAKATPADKAAPRVKLSAPSNRATVAGNVLISGTATDNVGVVKVELYVDQVLQPGVVSSVPLPSFVLLWPSAKAPNGSHVFTVKAYDAAGNSDQDNATVSVSNQAPPPATGNTGGSPATDPKPAQGNGGGNASSGSNGNGGNSANSNGNSSSTSGGSQTSGGNSGSTTTTGSQTSGGNSGSTTTTGSQTSGGNGSPTTAGSQTSGGSGSNAPAGGQIPSPGNGGNGTASGGSSANPPAAPAPAESGSDAAADPEPEVQSSAAQSGPIDLSDLGGASTENAAEYVPGQLLVQTRQGVSEEEAGKHFAAHGAKSHRKIRPLGVSVIRVPAGSEAKVTEALMKTGQFTFVEPDHVVQGTSMVPNDPDFPYEWHLSKIQAPAAWDRTVGSASQVIAIIDTGVDPNHEDLSSKLVAGYDFLGQGGTSDVNGHGTAVAGLAGAASNNGVGVSGVAWGTKIMPIRVVDSSGNTTYSAMANAITWAADHGARVISMSLAGPSASSTLQNAVNYAWNKGSVLFAAAGNYSTSSPYYPAACDNVVAVGASDANDALSGYSNYGNWVDLVAPGDNLMSTNNGGGYGYYTGTSGSTPVTAGVAALVLSANPNLTASQLVSILKQNADDLGAPGVDNTFGSGRVNAYRAVTAAGGGGSTDTTAPAVSITSPANGATVSGTISITGTSSDAGGISKVELYVDNALKSSTTAAAFSFSWNSTTVGNGSHTILVKAYDPSNNIGSASVSLNVNNVTVDTTPPTVSISSPANGATVSGSISIFGTAGDAGGILKVELYIDNVLKGSTASGSYNFSWDTTTAANGSHTILVKGYDPSNNIGLASIAVNVSNGAAKTDSAVPTVTITSPTSGSKVKGNVRITAAAWDDMAVAQVAFYVDGGLKCTVSTAPYTCNWNTGKASNGNHTISATVWDTSSKNSSTSITVLK